MATNNFEIDINASVKEVWSALTNSTELAEWMKNITVQTEWKQGSEIIYTCYDKNGDVLQWSGMDMIWKGEIKIMDEEKELTCVYPDKSTGLEAESYLLKKLAADKTKLIQVQQLTSQEVADGYKQGTAHTLELLKNHLEKKGV
jgi:uncharacterized protein YndB with AHSA1/START domain